MRSTRTPGDIIPEGVKLKPAASLWFKLQWNGSTIAINYPVDVWLSQPRMHEHEETVEHVLINVRVIVIVTGICNMLDFHFLDADATWNQQQRNTEDRVES